MSIFDDDDAPKIKPWDVANRAAVDYIRRFDANPASIRLVTHTVDFGDFSTMPSDEEFEWYGQRGKIRTVFRLEKAERWVMRINVTVDEDIITIRRTGITADITKIMPEQILAAFRAHQMRQARMVASVVKIGKAVITVDGVRLDQP